MTDGCKNVDEKLYITKKIISKNNDNKRQLRLKEQMKYRQI